SDPRPCETAGRCRQRPRQRYRSISAAQEPMDLRPCTRRVRCALLHFLRVQVADAADAGGKPVRPRIPPLHPRIRGAGTHGLWPIGSKPRLGCEGTSWPIAARLHLSAVDAAGEFRRTTRGKNARLLHPILALDATFEVEGLADAIDLLRRPVGNLLVADDAHLIELLLNQHADATDPFEVLRGCAAQSLCRADAQ